VEEKQDHAGRLPPGRHVMATWLAVVRGGRAREGSPGRQTGRMSSTKEYTGRSMLIKVMRRLEGIIEKVVQRVEGRGYAAPSEVWPVCVATQKVSGPREGGEEADRSRKR